jgi:hypothetical protein
MEERRMAGSQSYPGTPLWVKGFGIAALIAIVLFAVLHLAGGGMGNLMDHGMVGHGPATPILEKGAESQQ